MKYHEIWGTVDMLMSIWYRLIYMDIQVVYGMKLQHTDHDDGCCSINPVWKQLSTNPPLAWKTTSVGVISMTATCDNLTMIMKCKYGATWVCDEEDKRHIKTMKFQIFFSTSKVKKGTEKWNNSCKSFSLQNRSTTSLYNWSLEAWPSGEFRQLLLFEAPDELALQVAKGYHCQSC